MKLNLGSGEQPLDGYTNLDGAKGDSIFPLPFGDGAADEIRASHVLEHFGMSDVPKVLAEWNRVLAPGGTLKIAVPDFRTVAQRYLAGTPEPTAGYIMGGQTDERDFHKALFDRETLVKHLSDIGLVLLSEWKSEIQDCASLPISLNLQGRKPRKPGIKVAAAMTTPRLGFNDMWNCAVKVLPRFGIELVRTGGAFWGHHLTVGIEKAIADHNPDYILTIDYDSVFTAKHLAALMQLACLYPDAGAIAPVQLGRGDTNHLFNIVPPDGAQTGPFHVAADHFRSDLIPLNTAHFGLTLINAEKLKALPHPWFLEVPNQEGRWSEGRVDPDIYFWRKWAEAGHSLMLATKVAIGHLELCVQWPDRELRPLWQRSTEWEAKGVPDEAWKGIN